MKKTLFAAVLLLVAAFCVHPAASQAWDELEDCLPLMPDGQYKCCDRNGTCRDRNPDMPNSGMNCKNPLNQFLDDCAKEVDSSWCINCYCQKQTFVLDSPFTPLGPVIWNVCLCGEWAAPDCYWIMYKCILPRLGDPIIP